MTHCQRAIRRCSVFLLGLCCAVMFSAHAATTPAPYVVLFVLDGTGHDVLDSAVQRGELPTITSLFYEHGTRFTHATTNFPSATSPNYPAMIAGLYPGHLGAPYMAWFDRSISVYRDFLGLSGRDELHRSVRNWYSEHASADTRAQRTLFDLLAPLRTTAIYVPYTAGATFNAPKYGFEAAWELFIRKRPEGLNRAAFRLLRKAFDAPTPDLPHFTMVGLFATDGLGHKLGTDTPRVRAALREADHDLAKFVEQLHARGIADHTYLVITSDHGMHDIRDIIPLAEQLRALGLHVSTGAPKADDHAVLAARGIASATLTFRAPQHTWRTPFDTTTLQHFPIDANRTFNILNWLRTQPTLDTVLVREPTRNAQTNVTTLYRGTRHAELQSVNRNGQQWYSYRPLRGDPLGLTRIAATAALCTGRPYPATLWNQRLAATPWPASVPQLAQIFDDGRAGDVIIVAADDLGFFHHKAATHGSYRAIDMQVPLLMHGPGIPRTARGTAQIVDLAPTIAAWFGRQFPSHIDGDNLFQ